jgi:hypothetical protein
MDIEAAMIAIIEEAERQGFFVRQLPSGSWQLKKNQDNWFFHSPRNAIDLLEILQLLIAAGLDWTRWE